MKYGISTWNTLKPMGARARLAPAVRSAIGAGRGVELWLDWTAEPALMRREAWPALADLVRGAPSLSAHSRLIHVFDLAILKEEIDLCARLSADPLVVHPHSLGFEAGTWDASYAPGRISDDDKRRLAAILAYARERSVRLALENGPMDLLAMVLEAADGITGAEQLGICVDTGHANLHHDLYAEPSVAFLEKFAPRLFQFHVSDNGGGGDEHKKPGAGNVDWQAVLEALARTGYSGPAVLELNYPDPAAAAADSIAFLDRASPAR
jgi:sugar phosphate isomerase/epimerase